MPEVSRFRGIRIIFNFDEHPPPHFHVEYAGFQATVNIQHLDVDNGELPAGARRRVLRWARLHQTELMAAWRAATNYEFPPRIDPLD